MNQKLKMAGFHVIGWTLFFALVLAFVQGVGQNFQPFRGLSFLLFALVYVALFYVNAAFLLPTLYLRKKYVSYFGLMFLLLVAVYFLKPFDRLVLHPERMRQEPPQKMFPPSVGMMPMPPKREPGRRPLDVDIVSIVLFLAVWSASSMEQIVRQWRTSERRAMQAEADKVSAELLFLKAQINPHFLFNTLNNIYSLAITKSEHTPDAILKLSSILRYVTDDARRDFVPLQSEVDCAHNYIELQKLRLSKKVTVMFSVAGLIDDKTIPPLLFMTFIENAFKYGISNHEPCTISIRASADEKSLHFVCKNKIFDRVEEEAGREGIGIENARKRLDYLYPKKYLLNIDTQKGAFAVDLTVIN